MKTKPIAVLLMIIATVFTTIAQVFYKIGANNLTPTGWYTNWQLPFGLILYGVAGVLLILALKKGEVSVLYPIFATAFVWVLLLSNYIFGEALTIQKWAAVAVILLGIVLISIGSRRNSALGYEGVV
jgi:multidrug transporter EmrE-like cation transporter